MALNDFKLALPLFLNPVHAPLCALTHVKCKPPGSIHMSKVLAEQAAAASAARVQQRRTELVAAATCVQAASAAWVSWSSGLNSR